MAMSSDDQPQSVEEAGALLGTAITRYNAGAYKTISPPKGTHSSFATISPVPSSELLQRLYSLRALLRNAPTDTPLVAAPSLLAGVLMKLLGISSTLATTPPTPSRTATPPMLSTPLRKLWVDCVVLCHQLGDGLSGNARINIFGFVRSMISLAAMNPRTAKAAGGTRIAALQVIAGLLEVPKLSVQLTSWALDIITLTQRALRSSGNGEPTYRIASIQTAVSVAIACRQASLKTRPLPGNRRLLLKGAMEDKAILEVVKLLKLASVDKFPEVRSAAATLGAMLAPMLIHTSVQSPRNPDGVAASPTTSLEDVMTIAFKNLDDESPDVAAGWAEALSRCMSTAVEFCSQVNAETISNRDVEGGDGPPVPETGKAGDSRISMSRKGVVSASVAQNLPSAIKYLVGVFVKVGGALVAPRAGGSFSTGGRAVRIGFSRTLVQLLRLQSRMNCVGEGKGVSVKEAIRIILSMVGSDMESQLSAHDKSMPFAESLDATSVVTSSTTQPSAPTGAISNPLFGQVPSANPLFGLGPKKSHADAGMARLATNRVLREGISEMAPETTQLTILHELVLLCGQEQAKLNGNQLQVVLIELSHLLVTLGEASASPIEEIVPALNACLRHYDHGVRHEAAVACAALTSVFPSEGRKLIQSAVDEIQLEHAELMALTSTKKRQEEPEGFGPSRLLRFGRRSPLKQKKVDDSIKHQYAIHGLALMTSMIVRDLPDLPGGLPIDLFATVLSVAEILSSSLFNEIMTEGSPSAACTCVRAGFGIICGALTTGPGPIAKHIAFIFGLWQKTSKLAPRGKTFTADHDLICMDAMLSSVVAFLKYCSELLLSIPDALSRTSLILEELLPLFMPKGRLGSTPANPAAASRLHSAKATIMEAFAWLPPGSYPMIADTVFSFAAYHIQVAIESDVTCSILRSLVNKEDMLLDAVSFSRAKRAGQVGGAKDLEQDIIMLTSEVAHHGERESVFCFHGPGKPEEKEGAFRNSQVLGMIAYDSEAKGAPTPLHEVGKWQTPVNPSCSSKVRLVDAAIQAFSATFGLKSGSEQQRAMQMLEALVPPVYSQLARHMGVTTSLVEQDRRAKSKEDSAAVANISAVLLSCLQTLPLQEATHNVSIGLGPPWMSKATDLLLTLLPSASHVVRRAAAEGLGLLATLGAKEDAHYLQSAVLHSLDEVMKGNQHDGKVRASPFEPVSGARAGSLLTLACIQRTAHNIAKKRTSRALGRSEKDRKGDKEDELPTFQMMTRVLPSIACYGARDFFIARTYALHSFGLLIAYSNRLESKSLSKEDEHLLRKAVEIVEDNFLAAWNVASYDYDRGNEEEKLSAESSFLAVLLRSMTVLIPSLHHIESSDRGTAVRFSNMATVIMEMSESHPVVLAEGMAFFEVLAAHQELLPAPSPHVQYSENPLLSCIPFLIANATPDKPEIQPLGRWRGTRGGLSSPIGLRATLRALKMISISQILVAELSDMEVVSSLYASLETTCGSRVFPRETFHRSLAAPREEEILYISGGNKAEREVADVLRLLLYLEQVSKKQIPVMLRWILLSRTLLAGTSEETENEDEDETDNSYSLVSVTHRASALAQTDIESILDCANPPRWQVKNQAVQMATVALIEMAELCHQDEMKFADSPDFNPKKAQVVCTKECRDAQSSGLGVPDSRLALHLSEIVTAACVTSTATVDQAELQILQNNAMHLLVELINCFGPVPDPEQPNGSILGQYIPQISSCIKNALGASTDQHDEISSRLFLVGCEALHAFVHTEVSTDKQVLKRMIRSSLPEADDVPFFEHKTGLPKEIFALDKSRRHMNNRASLLLRIGKLWSLGNLPDSEYMSMVNAGKPALGANSAALALDGACLLLGSGLSLCGITSEQPNDEDLRANMEFGFFYENIMDIDDSVRGGLAKTWASCAYSAARYLSEAITSEDIASEQREACLVWLRKVVPLLFTGLQSSIAALTTTYSKTGIVDWARGVDPQDVAENCLQGIRSLMAVAGSVELHDKWDEELDRAVSSISKAILLPILNPEPGDSAPASQRDLPELKQRDCQADLAFYACSVIGCLTATSPVDTSEGSAFLIAILSPLQHLANDHIDLQDETVGVIMSSCMASVASLISRAKVPNSLVKAILPLVMQVLSNEKKPSDKIKSASSSLLKVCLAHESVTVNEQSAIATEMAKTGKWDTWAVVCSVNEGRAAGKSLEVVQSRLVDSSRTDQQLAALGAVRELVQSTSPPSPLLGRIVFGVGAEVLGILQAYATLNVPSQAQSQRATVCAECMKIALVAHQQLRSDAVEDDIVTGFLIVLFEAFIVVLRFNGLPNHPPPQSQSDPALGRMCAQASLHVARTTPAPFKTCMASMAEHDRAVLEFAVRGEMSGYATSAAPAAVKKKISLAGFKK